MKGLVFTIILCSAIISEHGRDISRSRYLEFQIHGPVRFAEDVARIVIPEKFRAQHRATAEQFATKFGCVLEWSTPEARTRATRS